jgi:predicted MFS family arabinose efflux permease
VGRDFRIFWAGQTLSEFGNAFGLVALPLLILQATGSVAQMGLLTAVSSVASIGTGLFVGHLVDLADRRRLMIACDVARIVLYGTIAVTWAVAPHVWLLYVVMGLAAVFEMTFKITYVTAVASLVDTKDIVKANGRLETTNAIAYIVGPSLAGLVSGWFGPVTALGVDAVSFGASAVALAAIRITRPDRPRDRGGFLVGFGFLWRTPVLRWITLLLTVVTFMSLGMTDVLIYHVRGQGDSVVGIVLGISGIGVAVAAMLTPMLRRRLGFGPSWLGSYVLCGLSVALVGLSSDIASVGPLVFVYMFGMAVAGISSMSLRQAVTPSHLLGRVTSAFWTVHSAIAPLGAAALTALVGRFGVQGPLLVVGAVFLLVVVVGVATPIRQRHPERVSAGERINGRQPSRSEIDSSPEKHPDRGIKG